MISLFPMSINSPRFNGILFSILFNVALTLRINLADYNGMHVVDCKFLKVGNSGTASLIINGIGRGFTCGPLHRRVPGALLTFSSSNAPRETPA